MYSIFIFLLNVFIHFHLNQKKKGIFLTGTITAVIIGPFIAGGIAYIADWQLCYLLLSLFVITMLIVHLLLVPETLNEKV